RQGGLRCRCEGMARSFRAKLQKIYQLIGPSLLWLLPFSYGSIPFRYGSIPFSIWPLREEGATCAGEARRCSTPVKHSALQQTLAASPLPYRNMACPLPGYGISIGTKQKCRQDQLAAEPLPE